MARGVALPGSLVVHAVGFAAILVVRGAPGPTSRSGGLPERSLVTLELAAPTVASPRPTPEAASRTPEAASRTPEAASRTPAPSPSAARRDPSGSVETTLQMERTGGRAAENAGGAVEPVESSGRPAGGGRGNGIGFGAGGGIASPVDTARLATPEPPRPSLARPPRLIWPVRQGATDDGPVFVAHVTVDRDGFVAGAQLVQGTRGDPGAADAVWRFRYDPALDEDGRPIAAAIDQPFLLR